MTRHIGSCKHLSGAIIKYLGRYEVKKIGNLLFAKQTATSLPSNHLTLLPSKRIAFTLAEVLITLGIIGVVAALTMPSLIQNHRKHVVETRLKKFYSTINQAIALAEIDYGAREDWYNNYYPNVELTDKNGNPIEGRSQKEKWVNKYLVPYMKILRIDVTSHGEPIIYFPDGSSLAQAHPNTVNMADWVYYVDNREKCKNLGVCYFYFYYNPIGNEYTTYIGRTFETYKFGWDGTEKQLYDDCKERRIFCTALIQYNGWKIPENYPFKF